MGEANNPDDDEAEGLCGKLLIAMPSMGDPRFEKTVIYMCAHSDDGALGLVVNRPAGNVKREDLFRQLEIEPGPGTVGRIHYGGPVETQRGFVLHSSDWSLEEATLEVDDRFSMTATVDVLKAIAEGVGPRRSIIALGYSGWAGGQLESELRRNGWLTVDADEELVFSLADDEKWSAALRRLGIDPALLSAEGGNA